MGLNKEDNLESKRASDDELQLLAFVAGNIKMNISSAFLEGRLCKQKAFHPKTTLDKGLRRLHEPGENSRTEKTLQGFTGLYVELKQETRFPQISHQTKTQNTLDEDLS